MNAWIFRKSRLYILEKGIEEKELGKCSPHTELKGESKRVSQQPKEGKSVRNEGRGESRDLGMSKHAICTLSCSDF